MEWVDLITKIPYPKAVILFLPYLLGLWTIMKFSKVKGDPEIVGQCIRASTILILVMVALVSFLLWGNKLP
ncbi:MAG: hypothetical protein AABY26_02380 [Nanoarchaeota archaeon]